MKKLLKNLKPYTGSLIICFILIFIQALLNLYLPNLMGDIVNVGVVNKDVNYILKTGMLMLVVALFSSIFNVASAYISAKVALSFSRDIREKIFIKVESFSLSEFDELTTSSLITRNTNDITQVQQVVIMGLRMMLSAPVTLVGALIMAFYTDSKLAELFLIIIPIIVVLVFIIAKKALPLFTLLQIKLDKLNLVLRENLMGVRIIRVFNRVGYEKKRFEDANIDYSETAIKANRLMGIMLPVMMFIMNMSMVAVIWFGGIRIDNGSLMVGNLMAFIQYLGQIMYSLIMLSIMFVLIPRATASATRISEVLDTKATIKDTKTGVKDTGIKATLEFKDVSFGYGNAESEAIKNISFISRPGETTAIIGGTGSGKSTILNLIPRFYDVTSGRILVDGVDIRDMDQKSLRNKIGYAPQKSMLFSGTIKENILHGKENASDEEILKALEISQAKDFVFEKDENINYILSQGATNLSGGQKQRLSIGRVIVKKPEIYLFDDSFSALDFKTDAKLRAALKGVTQDSTVVIVAQRVSTVMDADNIIVLDDGEVAGIGKHDTLLKTCDVYKEIVASQFAKEEA